MIKNSELPAGWKQWALPGTALPLKLQEARKSLGRAAHRLHRECQAAHRKVTHLLAAIEKT